jgi:hypothetical protein
MTSVNVVALSGGKDSTAMALRLKEVYPDKEFIYLTTPTGDELQEAIDHWNVLETLVNQPLVRLNGGTLNGWIDHFQALPNNRQRWCTRLLKIQPCLAFLEQFDMPTLWIGLRADEDEKKRKGLYSPDVQRRFPLREWGWGLEEVKGYLQLKAVEIPRRTDCARCFDQRLVEWKRLWLRHPGIYAHAEGQEERIGRTFRSPSRDTWPAGLKELREEFRVGRRIRGEDKYWESERCAVCLI